jgi:hypothetical protein
MWRIWFRHSPKGRKVAGSIAGGSLGFFIDLILLIDSASSRSQYQEYFLWDKGCLCVGLTNIPPSCADCLEIWEPHPLGTSRACPRLYRDCFTLLLSQVKQTFFQTKFHFLTRCNFCQKPEILVDSCGTI